MIRVLALGAAAVLCGGLLVSSQQLPAPAQPSTPTAPAQPSAPATPAQEPAQVEQRLPAYVVGPSVTLAARPVDHPATGRPVGVSVPRLGITVSVVEIGLSDGALVPPSDPQLLGWWGSGAEPGARRGTAVITGHTVSTGGGALDDLHRLAPGDRVVVTTDAGRIRYEVTAVARYAKPSLARFAEQVFSQAVPGRLLVVTCTDFDGVEYLANTLVFARPVR